MRSILNLIYWQKGIALGYKLSNYGRGKIHKKVVYKLKMLDYNNHLAVLILAKCFFSSLPGL